MPISDPDGILDENDFTGEGKLSMSLRTKISLSFLACILIVFLPILVITETQLRPVSERQILRQTQQLASAKAAEVGSWLNQRISEIRILHEFPGTQQLDFDQLRPVLSALNEQLRQQYGNPEETLAVGGLDGRGWISDTLTIDVRDRPYFQKLMSTDAEYVISNPVISKSDDKPIFLICYPIRNPLGEKIGFINGSVNLDRFTGILDSFSIYDGFSWIMNRQGIPYTASEDAFETCELTESDLIQIVDSAELSGWMKLENQPGKTIFYAAVPYAPDWLYCIQVSDSQLFASFDQVVDLLYDFCLFLLCVAAVLAIVLSRSITAPIRRLEQAVHEVASGNLSAVVVNPHQDEIGRLGGSFNTMVGEIRRLMQRQTQVQRQQRQAELRALQAQVNPHFLYNTLDTIQWKALEYNAVEVADMIFQLSQMFRLALNDGRELISVAEELQHTESYLKLQKIRLEDLFSAEIDCPDEARELLIPKLILQPLVENALVHGIDRQRRDGRIDIRVRLIGDQIEFTISDNGCGMSEDRLREMLAELQRHESSDHYGLYNVNERLVLSFRDQYYLSITNLSPHGLSVSLRFPFTREGYECCGF